jgi:hypothetical protein
VKRRGFIAIVGALIGATLLPSSKAKKPRLQGTQIARFDYATSLGAGERLATKFAISTSGPITQDWYVFHRSIYPQKVVAEFPLKA